MNKEMIMSPFFLLKPCAQTPAWAPGGVGQRASSMPISQLSTLM